MSCFQYPRQYQTFGKLGKEENELKHRFSLAPQCPIDLIKADGNECVLIATYILAGGPLINGAYNVESASPFAD